ncbi:hypothetical protein WJX77_006453 [Trebouxia sp. C0004]
MGRVDHRKKQGGRSRAITTCNSRPDLIADVGSGSHDSVGQHDESARQHSWSACAICRDMLIQKVGTWVKNEMSYTRHADCNHTSLKSACNWTDRAMGGPQHGISNAAWEIIFRKNDR